MTPGHAFTLIVEWIVAVGGGIAVGAFVVLCVIFALVVMWNTAKS